MSSSLNARILQLALPAIAANITTPLLSLADVAISGHLGKAEYIAAIALGGAMFNMLYWLFGFLRMGTSGITAQCVGAGDSRQEAATLWRALSTATLAGVILIALSRPVSALLMTFFDASPEVTLLARTYFDAGIYGAPAMLATYTLSGWFLGMQSSRPIMWMAIVANVANLAISATLVFGMHTGVTGMAIGTATAQWIGAAIGLSIVLRKFHPLSPLALGLKQIIDATRISRLFKINTDIFLRTVCLVGVTMWFTRSGARAGADILAANAMLMQLFMLFSFFMDGFAFAGEALAGRYYGAKDPKMLHNCIHRLMGWGMGISLAATLIYFIGGMYIMRMLTNDVHTLDVVRDYRYWAVTIPLASFMAFVWDGVFIGMTKTRRMLVAMAIAMSVFFIVYFIATPLLGNHGLWLAFVTYLLTRGVASELLSRKATSLYDKRPE